MANIIVFAIIAVVIIAAALAAVFTKHIMRSVTALLFVLFAIAGLYFLLDYTFLGAAQLSIYAGGMTMIYIFAIQLLGRRDLQGYVEKLSFKRTVGAAIVSLVGCVTVVGVMLKNFFIEVQRSISTYFHSSSSHCSCLHVSSADLLFHVIRRRISNYGTSRMFLRA